MAFDAHTNFAYSTVATAPSPATSGTTLIVAAGDGTRFPAVPFNAVVWAASQNPLHTTAEVVRVTGRSTDTLTITRAQESSSARTIVTGDQIMAAVTSKTLTDIENTALPSGSSFPGSPEDGQWFWRTDRNLTYFYKASITSWLSTDLKHVSFGQPQQFIGSTTVGNGLGLIPVWEDVYVEKWITTIYVASANDGGDYYAAQLLGNATVLSSFDTAGDTSATRTVHQVGLNTLYSHSTYQWFEYLVVTRTGSPGSVYSTSMLTMRAVG